MKEISNGYGTHCREYSNEYAGPMYEEYLILSRMLNFTLQINSEIDASCGSNGANSDAMWRRDKGPTIGSNDLSNLINGQIDAVGEVILRLMKFRSLLIFLHQISIRLVPILSQSNRVRHFIGMLFCNHLHGMFGFLP